MKVSKVLIEQDEIEQKVKELAERINKDYSGEELVIVGILKGAFIAVSYTHLTLPTIYSV